MSGKRRMRQSVAAIIVAATMTAPAALAQSAGDLRLVSGATQGEGELEYFHGGTWGLVCDDGWDLNDAHVACRQMGFARAVRATTDVEFGTNKPGQTVWLDQVACAGTELTLASCPTDGKGVGSNDCGRFEAAGVECEGELATFTTVTISKTAMTLTEGDSTGDTYTLVLDTQPSDNITLTVDTPTDSGISASPASVTFTPITWSTAQTITLTASTSSYIGDQHYYVSHEVEGNGRIPPGVKVRVRETETGGRHVGGALRLTGGATPNEGKIEIYLNVGPTPGWGLVCGDNWGWKDAVVACRQLGYSAVAWTGDSQRFGRIDGRPTQISNLDCKGDEASLIQCARTDQRALGTQGNACRNDRWWRAEVRCSGTGTTVAVADASGEEGTDDALMFTVTLNQASTGTVYVSYATSDGTANAGSDYTATSGELQFAAGETSKTISVPIIDDGVEDSGETMTLTLSNVQGARIEDETATGTIGNVEVTPLGATFANSLTDERHDGTAFALELRFDQEAPVSWRALHDAKGSYSAFTVTNGSVTGVRRVRPGFNQRWTVSITPSGNDDVTVTLNPSTDCTTRALCTTDGGGLEDPVTTTVQGPAPSGTNDPLTVAFAAGHTPPAEHDGSSAFTFRINFSENLKGYSWRSLRDESLDITQNGSSLTPTVRRVHGGDPARANQVWDVTVTPGSKHDIALSLGASPECDQAHAMCTANRKRLLTGLSHTVLGPPGLSVADATVVEAPGATVDFTVTMSRASSETVTVDYATSDGTATAGADYTSTSGTLTLAAGATEGTVSVPVLDDSINEGSESFTLTLSNPSGGNAHLTDASATGTITNADAMPAAWLSRFGRTVAGQVVEAIGDRIRGASAEHVRVAGVELGQEPNEGWEQERTALGLEDLEAAQGTGQARMTLGQAFSGSSFLVGSDTEGGGAEFTGWGRYESGRFDADTGRIRIDGDVGTAFLGADVGNARWLAGAAIGQSEGDGTYTMREGGSGEVESSLSAVYPYAKVAAGEQIDLWAVVGMGWGTMKLTENADGQRTAAQHHKTDLSMEMGAIGAIGELRESTRASPLAVALKSDALWVRTESEAVRGAGGNLEGASTMVSRVRMGIEASHPVATGTGVLTPSVEIAARHDGGDAETGAGLEVGGAVRYEGRRFSIEGAMRMLAAHEESGYEEWGASATIRMHPGAGGHGLSLSVTPVWGNGGKRNDGLWGAEHTGSEHGNAFEAGQRTDAAIGYGIAGPGARGVVTPYAAIAIGDDSRAWRGGTRWDVAQDFGLGVEASAANGNDHAVMLRMRARF